MRTRVKHLIAKAAQHDAEKGEPEQMVAFAGMLLAGDGVDRDPAQARRLLTEASRSEKANVAAAAQRVLSSGQVSGWFDDQVPALEQVVKEAGLCSVIGSELLKRAATWTIAILAFVLSVVTIFQPWK